MSRPITTRRTAAVSVTLFACLLAAQAAVIAAAPVLAQLSADLDVSTAVAGQLRTVAGLAAAVTAIGAGRMAGRLTLARQLIAGAALVAASSTASALAPSFGFLLLAQVPLGVGVAALNIGATLAVTEWVPAEHRRQVLSWVLVGQPAAWIVGMPLVGFVGASNWRWAWVVFPLVAAVVAGIAVTAIRCTGDAAPDTPAASLRVVLADRTVVRWLASELLANAAWVGSLVYSGALLVEADGTSATVTGLLLALVAIAYIVGTLAMRRLSRLDPHDALRALALALAVVEALVWTARLDVAATTGMLALSAMLAGGRTLVASAFALDDTRGHRTALTGLRVAMVQLGYFVGSIVGGVALAAGGFAVLGAAFGALLVAAAALVPRRAQAPAVAPARRPATAASG
jgi:predicted MFS family arabinose efflux permease